MTQQTALTADVAGISAAGNQFLTFLLGEENFGVEILRVQEIKGYSVVTPIPNTPPHIRGVMNLRGTIVPVVDLRAKFQMPAVEYNKFTVIIVVTMGTKVVGLVVDAVADVLDVPESEIKPAPDLCVRADSRFLRGMTTSGERVTVLLDVDRLLSQEDAAVLDSVGGKEISNDVV